MEPRPAVFPADRPAVEAVLREAAARSGFPALSEEARVALDAATGRVGWLAPGAFAHLRQSPGAAVVEVVVAGLPAAAAALMAAIGDDHRGPVRVWATDPDVVEALQAAGAARSRSLVRLQRPLPAGEATPPEDARIVPFRRGVDEPAYLLVANEAFAGHPESGGWTRATFEQRAARPWFDASGLFLAWGSGVPLGVVWTKLHGGGLGEVYSVAVRPRAAGRGLGRSLVLTGLDDLHRRLGATVGMLWADEANPAAVRLYRALGMEPVRRRVELLAG